MRIDNRIQVAALFVLITVAGILITTSKKINLKKPIRDQRNELVCDSKTNAGLVQVRMIPAALFYEDNSKADGVYVLRIKLKAKQFLQNKKLTQYMNFGIGRFFFAVQGGDTLQQTACEKIPGIEQNEFVYIACFERRSSGHGSNLFIYVADTMAGFGCNRFEFKNKALQKLE